MDVCGRSSASLAPADGCTALPARAPTLHPYPAGSQPRTVLLGLLLLHLPPLLLPRLLHPPLLLLRLLSPLLLHGLTPLSLQSKLPRLPRPPLLLCGSPPLSLQANLLLLLPPRHCKPTHPPQHVKPRQVTCLLNRLRLRLLGRGCKLLHLGVGGILLVLRGGMGLLELGGHSGSRRELLVLGSCVGLLVRACRGLLAWGVG